MERVLSKCPLTIKGEVLVIEPYHGDGLEDLASLAKSQSPTRSAVSPTRSPQPSSSSRSTPQHEASSSRSSPHDMNSARSSPHGMSSPRSSSTHGMMDSPRSSPSPMSPGSASRASTHASPARDNHRDNDRDGTPQPMDWEATPTVDLNPSHSTEAAAAATSGEKSGKPAGTSGLGSEKLEESGPFTVQVDNLPSSATESMLQMFIKNKCCKRGEGLEKVEMRGTKALVTFTKKAGM